MSAPPTLRAAESGHGAPPAPSTGVWQRLAVFLEMIKFSHTVFALPFALGSTFLAAGGWPGAALLGKIVLAVLLARTAAMAFNRLCDHRLDAANPRTARRALPSGLLDRRFVGLTVLLAGAGFLATAAWINSLAAALAPLVLAVLLSYSWSKRFTLLCHAWLGAALALAPVGAWIAVRGELAGTPLILGLAVLLWTAGFDIVYACLDADFDQRARLHSVPARFGVTRALRIAATLHAAMIACLLVLWRYEAQLGGLFLAAVIVVSALLVLQHRLVGPRDLSRMNHAFLTLNGTISFILLAACVGEALRS